MITKQSARRLAIESSATRILLDSIGAATACSLSGAPQLLQNFPSAGFSVAHFGQFDRPRRHGLYYDSSRCFYSRRDLDRKSVANVASRLDDRPQEFIDCHLIESEKLIRTLVKLFTCFFFTLVQ